MILRILIPGVILAVLMLWCGAEEGVIARIYIISGMLIVFLHGLRSLAKKQKHGIFSQITEPKKFYGLDIELSGAFIVGVAFFVIGILVAIFSGYYIHG